MMIWRKSVFFSNWKRNSSDRTPSIFTVPAVFSSEQQELLRLDAVELDVLGGYFGTILTGDGARTREKADF
jgi:hypothetical protein